VAVLRVVRGGTWGGRGQRGCWDVSVSCGGGRRRELGSKSGWEGLAVDLCHKVGHGMELGFK